MTQDVTVKGPEIGPDLSEDDLANREALEFSQQTLQADEARKNHTRKQRFNDHLIKAVILGFWVGVAILVVLGLTWFYHVLMPESYHYLGSDQLDKIQTMLFSGLVSGLLTGLAKRYL